MSWLSLIVGLINLANTMMDWAHDRKMFKEGEDAAIARAAASIFQSTEHAKKIREKIDAMSDSEVDAVLVGFEPPDNVPNDK